MLDTLIYDLVLTLFCNIACRLARRREYERSRREAMGTRGGAVDEGAGETTESSPSVFHNLVVDDPEIIQILQQFHSNLTTLENVMCNICLEQFPCITTDVSGLCRRCYLDTETPKLFSGGNNMDPGPVPPELYVSYVN